MENRGRVEHAEGTGEYNAARAEGYAEGTGDRIAGKKDSVVGAITGDRSQQHSGTWSQSREGRAAADLTSHRQRTTEQGQLEAALQPEDIGLRSVRGYEI